LIRFLSSFSTSSFGFRLSLFMAITFSTLSLIFSGSTSYLSNVFIKNGSVFCACLKSDFINALIAMSSAELDYIFIEASGLADPSSMEKVLDGAVLAGGHPFDYMGAVCVTDAVCFARHAMVLPALASQVAYSGAVIINKTDLVTAREADAVEEAVIDINPSAVIFRAVRCDVPVFTLAECCRAERVPVESSNTRASRLRAVTLRTAEKVTKDALNAFVHEMAPSAYRIKGFCRTDSGGIFISAAGDQAEFSICALPEKTELVIISSVGIAVISKIIRAAEKCFSEPPELI
jgi:G3E family GTPase